jgi:hypothetical protein
MVVSSRASLVPGIGCYVRSGVLTTAQGTYTFRELIMLFASEC